MIGVKTTKSEVRVILSFGVVNVQTYFRLHYLERDDKRNGFLAITLTTVYLIYKVYVMFVLKLLIGNGNKVFV